MGLTTQQFIDELKRSLGNRTDISDERYVRWLNWAILDVCGFHRKRMYRPVRFHELESKLLFKVNVIDATLSNATDSTVEVSGADISSKIDAYTDCAITVGGSTYFIIDYDGSVVTIAGTWDTNPVGGDVGTIHKRFYDIEDDIGFSPKEELWVIEKMSRVPSGEELSQIKWDDLEEKALTETGVPSEFARYGNNLVLIPTPSEDYTYRMYIYKFPATLDVAVSDAECILPDTYDEVIVLGAMWRGYQKLMEPERAGQAQKHYLAEIDNRHEAHFMEDGNIRKGFSFRRS